MCIGYPSAGDIVVVLGDFNAQIGRKDSEDDVSEDVMGLAFVMKLVSSSLSCMLLTI